ncbi:Outer membrane protein assembly factor BamB precursor [Anatilimnocola aggregata]|uniref:Outer membrane protein assembly factor BamB n=2 Tax=Anatilimnocola aggregata TaxID=2528021 RepID=A0A517Y8R0_9BACT|nr:Outer membrane protein assembly factor BamB precursor [Anatilimnocola aggregata]
MAYKRWLCILVAVAIMPLPAPGEDWLQWRGPTRDGFYRGLSWPESLDEKNLRTSWRVELGQSYSGPIVSGKRVFTTETVNADKERVRAFDRDTGEELWQTEWKGSLIVPFFAWANGSWIRATPACDGETLYVAGIRDVLVALDVSNGKERWRVNFVDEYKTPVPSFGFVASPLIDGDHLYVQAAAGVVKLDKRTGEVVWREFHDEGGMNGSAFSSPIIATIDGVRQLVVQAREKLAGLALDSGNVLWSQKVPAFRGMNIITPTIIGDLAFTSTYGGKTVAYRIHNSAPMGESPNFSVETAWEEPAQGYMSSPVVIAGHAYVHLRNQRFACFNLESGKRTWTSEPFGKYWSVIARGDRLLALDEKGELLLIAANPSEFKLLSRRKVSDESAWAHLAVADGQLFVRELNALSVLQWKEE